MRKTVLPAGLSTLLLSLACAAYASTRLPAPPSAELPAAARPQASWETYTFKDEEFSVKLPEMPVLDHATRDMDGLPNQRRTVRDYAAYGDDVVYLIRAYDQPREGEGIDYFFKDFAARLSSESDIIGIKMKREMTLGKFPGRQYAVTRDSRGTTPPASSIYVFLTKRHAYAVRAAGGDDSHSDVRRFISSFTLADKPAGRQIVDEIPRPSSATLAAATAPSSPDKKRLLAGDPRSNGSAPKTDGDRRGVGKGENPGVGNGIGSGMGSGMGSGVGSGMGSGVGSGMGNGIGSGSGASGGMDTGYRPPEPGSEVVDYNKTFAAREVTRKAQIIHKPEPHYTKEARRNEVSGTVRLRLVLSASGQVKGSVPVSRLPDGLTEMAIRAARHIKFIPAVKDGRRVSQYATVEYIFNLD